MSFFFGTPKWRCTYCGKDEHLALMHSMFIEECPIYGWTEARRKAIDLFVKEYQNKNPKPPTVFSESEGS